MVVVVEFCYIGFEACDAFVGAEPDIAFVVFGYGTYVCIVQSVCPLIYLIVFVVAFWKAYQAVAGSYPDILFPVFVNVIDGVRRKSGIRIERVELLQVGRIKVESSSKGAYPHFSLYVCDDLAYQFLRCVDMSDDCFRVAVYLVDAFTASYPHQSLLVFEDGTDIRVV